MQRLLVRIAWRGAARALLASLTAAPLLAQGTGSIRGTITERESRRGVPNVQVLVVGTGNGSVTGQNGQYTITNVPVGERTVRIRRLGFQPVDKPVTVTSGESVALDIALTSSITQLEQLVVTGTAGAAEKRTIGNSITQLNVAELTEKTTINNVSEVLQAKTPGVTLMAGSGAPGSAGELRIRGASSLAGYKPVVFVDGVRYNIEQLGTFAATGAGSAGLAQSSQVTSALDFLNPNDIESIEVLKGPAAATLYGAEAANGVIQIITKKGTRGQQSLQWSARAERGQNEWVVQPDANYTTCDSAKADPRSAAFPQWSGCRGVPLNAIISETPIMDDPRALRTGDLSKLSLNVRGGGDRYSFYLSGDRVTEQGVFFNNDQNNKSVRSNFTFNPNDKADFAVNLNWQENAIRLPMQDESALGLLLSSSRGRPGRDSTYDIRNGARPITWSTILPARANGYKNFTNGERLTLSGTLNYAPRSWFRNRMTLGVDNTTTQAQLLFLPGDEGEPTGANLRRTPITRIVTLDYSGNLAAHVGTSLELTTSFGSQVVANKTERLDGTGTGLGAPDVTLVGTAQVTSASETFTEKNSVGYFIQEQVGWKNRLFVTGAVRADDNSAFGTNFDVITYPKFSVSYVASEEPALAGLVRATRLSSLKVRGAWGQAGRAPDPYTAPQTFTVTRVTLGTATGSALITSGIGNPDLKPERGEEFELGFDAGLFSERVGMEFTYYNKTTSDMLQSVSTAPSTGFTAARLSNLGEVTNSGFEVVFSATPVTHRHLGWDARITLATNRNRLVTFGASIDRLNPTGQAYATVQQHRPGYPLGGYWVSLPKRNADGSPVLNAAGQPDTVGQARFLGSSAPTREVGFSNTFTLFRYIRLYALLDYKGGFSIFNQRERNRCQTANDNCWTTNDPRARFPKTASDTLLAKELIVWRTVPGAFIEKADFVKLREVSVTLTPPARLVTMTRARNLNVVLSARNLALWSDYTGMDPEVSSYGGRNFVRADAYASPNLRRFMAAVNLSF